MSPLERISLSNSALTVLNLDTAPTEELLCDIRASEDIHSVQVIQF